MLDRDAAQFMAALEVIAKKQDIGISLTNISRVSGELKLTRIGMSSDFDPSVLEFTVEFWIIGGDIQTTAHDSFKELTE